jgi:high-affinity nickel permease
MVTFDSTTVSNIFLACIALSNIIIMAMLYERFFRQEAAAKKNKK